jgi:hypothetical protein
MRVYLWRICANAQNFALRVARGVSRSFAAA